MARIAKWGNSLAVRLPASLVNKHALRDGDDIQVAMTEGGVLKITRDEARAKALEALGKLGWTLPADYKFDREEAHRRGGGA